MLYFSVLWMLKYYLTRPKKSSWATNKSRKIYSACPTTTGRQLVHSRIWGYGPPGSWRGRRSSSWCWSCTHTASDNAGPEHTCRMSGQWFIYLHLVDEMDKDRKSSKETITKESRPGKALRTSLRSPWHRSGSSRTHPTCTCRRGSRLGSGESDILEKCNRQIIAKKIS